jgi:cysteine desulfurase
VGEPAGWLGRNGFRVDRLRVDGAGRAVVGSMTETLRVDTRLIAVMLVNHETGAVQPIRRLVGAAGGAEFHCDATQAVGKVSVDFHDLGVTTLALSAHKFHGPKGIGALLVRHGSPLRPHHWGGYQQQGRRPGTEPVALAVGLAAALDLAHREREVRMTHVRRLRSLLLSRLRDEAAPVEVNGPDDVASDAGEAYEGVGLPHTLNVSFPGCRGESLLINLDLAGVACSTGSACSSGSLLPSPVLQAMGVSECRLHSAIRFGFSPLLTPAEVAEAGRRVAEVVRRLRQNAGGTPGE